VSVCVCVCACECVSVCVYVCVYVRVSEAGAGEVGVCEVTPWSLLLEPLGFFIGTKHLCIAFTRKYYDFLTLFIACETVSVCFSVTVTEAARFVSVNRAVAFSQSKYCNFTGVIL